ncbi:MAG: hypothetical protein ABW034_26420, partial [Steroidobacteraceae bacterium]
MNATVASSAAPDPRQKRRLIMGVAVFVAGWGLALALVPFHAQTFLSVTEPLTDRELRILFPSGEQMQCWDS